MSGIVTLIGARTGIVGSTTGAGGSTSASDLDSGTLAAARMASGTIINSHMEHFATRTATAGSSGFTSLFSFSYDKTVASSDLCVIAHVPMYSASAGSMSTGFKYASTRVVCGSFTYVPSAYMHNAVVEGKITGHTTTGSQTMVIGYEAEAGGSHKPANVHCPNGTDDTRLGQTIACALVYEKLN